MDSFISGTTASIFFLIQDAETNPGAPVPFNPTPVPQIYINDPNGVAVVTAQNMTSKTVIENGVTTANWLFTWSIPANSVVGIYTARVTATSLLGKLSSSIFRPILRIVS